MPCASSFVHMRDLVTHSHLASVQFTPSGFSRTSVYVCLFISICACLRGLASLRACPVSRVFVYVLAHQILQQMLQVLVMGTALRRGIDSFLPGMQVYLGISGLTVLGSVLYALQRVLQSPLHAYEGEPDNGARQ